ncbi:hypothetical protein PMAYCL1PPCAC_13818, partial [Pristionchus mayeri]
TSHFSSSEFYHSNNNARLRPDAVPSFKITCPFVDSIPQSLEEVRSKVQESYRQLLEERPLKERVDDMNYYKCYVANCRKEYTDPSSLRRHIKKVHGEAAWDLTEAHKQPASPD